VTELRRGRLSHLLMVRSLAGRLALSGVAWIALWALGLLLAFNVLLANVLADQVDASLRARAEAVAATIQVHNGQLKIASSNDDALDTATSIYLGQVLQEGTDLSPALRQALVQRGQRTADRETLGIRYLAAPIMAGQQQIGTIVVSTDIGQRSHTERIIGLSSVILIGLLLVFTFFALRGTVGRAMRPVRTMGDQVSAWSDKDLDRRFDPDAGPLELRRLAITLNSLLERIAATVRHERQFTAELSHELRTPLAHLHAEVDLLASAAADPIRPEPVGQHDLEALMTSIRRLEGLVESALSPARVEQESAPGLGRMADVLAHLPNGTASTAALSVTGDTGILLAVEADIARRALLPVLENAWRYAVHEVRIEVRARDGMASVIVSDDGGRLNPDQAEMIFVPGFRADPTDGYPGAGLGLALTRRICRAAGGDANAAGHDGWSVVTLQFPCIVPVFGQDGGAQGNEKMSSLRPGRRPRWTNHS
jgi:two-component system heavy metal sensor histidine kinase CusS